MSPQRTNNDEFLEPPRYSIMVAAGTTDVGADEVKSHLRTARELLRLGDYDAVLAHTERGLNYAKQRRDLADAVKELEALQATAYQRLDSLKLEATGAKDSWRIGETAAKRVDQLESARQGRIKAQRDQWEAEAKADRVWQREEERAAAKEKLRLAWNDCVPKWLQRH